MHNVPLLDLTLQYQSIAEELNEALMNVVQSQRFILGDEVEAFEAEIASYCQAKHCVGVSSGSDALLLTLMALGIGAGDEVIVPTFTFFATAGAVTRVGATPVFVDIDPVSFNIDPKKIQQQITPKTKAIIPVHLFGQCVDMDAINAIADRHGLAVIEDAAQAIGAEVKGKRAGSIGTAGCFSFFPSKNLGAFGDAGAITTNDSELYDKLVCMRVHGGKTKYYYDVIGGNFRIDALQAAVLRVKLRYLDQWTNARQENAQIYETQLRSAGLDGYVTVPQVTQDRHIFNQFTIRVSDRDALRESLLRNNVGCEIYYPVPLHQQKCFQAEGKRSGALPVSEMAAQSVLSLPIYPELTDEQLHIVIDAIAEHHAGSSQRRAA